MGLAHMRQAETATRCFHNGGHRLSHFRSAVQAGSGHSPMFRETVKTGCHVFSLMHMRHGVCPSKPKIPISA